MYLKNLPILYHRGDHANKQLYCMMTFAILHCNPGPAFRPIAQAHAVYVILLFISALLLPGKVTGHCYIGLHIWVQIIYAMWHVTFYFFPMSPCHFFMRHWRHFFLQLLKWPCRTSFFTHVEPSICLEGMKRKTFAVTASVKLAFSYRKRSWCHAIFG